MMKRLSADDRFGADRDFSTSRKSNLLHSSNSTLVKSESFFFQKKIGNYNVGDSLGRGKYGTVKKGVHTQTGKTVAIKIIDKTLITSSTDRSAIRTEAEVMSRLNHPHVIALYDVIENKGGLCMIMEFAGGGDLFRYITKHTKIKEGYAKRFFKQILSGICYCHKHYIIHRDIKAENIFLDDKLHIKIGDWGFSQIYNPGCKIETACGSLDYASPEILSRKPHFGPEVDVWALGVLLYFMVSGKLPFRDSNEYSIYCNIKSGSYPKLRSVSPVCRKFVDWMLNVDSNARPTTEEVSKHKFLNSGSSPRTKKKKKPTTISLKRPKGSRIAQIGDLSGLSSISDSNIANSYRTEQRHNRWKIQNTGFGVDPVKRYQRRAASAARKRNSFGSAILEEVEECNEECNEDSIPSSSSKKESASKHTSSSKSETKQRVKALLKARREKESSGKRKISVNARKLAKKYRGSQSKKKRVKEIRKHSEYSILKLSKEELGLIKSMSSIRVLEVMDNGLSPRETPKSIRQNLSAPVKKASRSAPETSIFTNRRSPRRFTVIVAADDDFAKRKLEIFRDVESGKVPKVKFTRISDPLNTGLHKNKFKIPPLVKGRSSEGITQR